jgi:GT2 family glycosyltransferase
MNDLTIIIVNWNTKEMLKNCINSIFAESNGIKKKIIVVDNASSDSSVEMIRSQFPEVHLIESGGNIGFGKANNLAIQLIKSPYVLFINPDTVVKNNSIKMMLNYLKTHKEVGCVGCKTVDRDGVVQELPLQKLRSPMRKFVEMIIMGNITKKILRKVFSFHDPNKSGYVNLLYGACIMAHSEIIKKIGGFDERFFMYCEDVDLCKNITDNGWKVYYISDVEIIHFCGGASTNSKKPFSILMMCESIMKMMEKYYGKKGKYSYRLIVFIASNIRLLLLILLFPMLFLFTHNKYEKVRMSMFKYMTMIKWSLNLVKPSV